MNISFLDINNIKLDNNKELKKSDVNETALNNLLNMGFSINRCKRALHESGNNQENAINLLLANMDNP